MPAQPAELEGATSRRMVGSRLSRVASTSRSAAPSPSVRRVSDSFTAYIRDAAESWW
jgi:hypothetical protein